MIVVIAGATGLVGSRLLQFLLAESSIREVIAVSRRPLAVSAPKLRDVILSDFTRLEAETERLRGDLYFCCLGSTLRAAGSQDAFRRIDHDAVVGFGRVALANRAKVFSVVSASGANPRSPFFYNRVKGEAEADLAALGLDRLVIFRPGLLLGEREEPRPGERAAIHVVRVLQRWVPASLTHRVSTDATHLAQRLLSKALQPDGPPLEHLSAKDI